MSGGGGIPDFGEEGIWKETLAGDKDSGQGPWAWASAFGIFVRTRASCIWGSRSSCIRVQGLASAPNRGGGGRSVGLGCIEPCCLVSRARLGGCGAGGARLVSCVRVRGLLPVDVSGSGLRAACAGSRARHRHPTPRLLAPLLAVRPPGRPPPRLDLAANFFLSVSRATNQPPGSSTLPCSCPDTELDRLDADQPFFSFLLLHLPCRACPVQRDLDRLRGGSRGLSLKGSCWGMRPSRLPPPPGTFRYRLRPGEVGCPLA